MKELCSTLECWLWITAICHRQNIILKYKITDSFSFDHNLTNDNIGEICFLGISVTQTQFSISSL